MVECGRSRGNAIESFRTDAKGDPDKVVLGGWCTADSTDTKLARWFHLELDIVQAPWLFRDTKRGIQSSPTISSGELLATMVATHLFVKADGSSSSVAKFKALTDNQGNAKMALKNITTKMPLAAVYMQLVLHLAAKDVEMELEWLSRDDNVPADAITNGNFELFSPELRIMVKLEDLDIALMMKLIDSWGEVEEMVKKRKLELAEAPRPQEGNQKKRKTKQVKSAWG
jgi:hypothetical protein